MLPADPRFVVRNIALKSLTDNDLECWRDLSNRSCEPNPFLSPDFVIPLVKYLNVSAPVMLLVVASAETGRWLVAGVFEIKALSRWWLLAYARSFSSDYSFLDGILVDGQDGAAAITQLFESQLSRRDCHGLHFGVIRGHSVLAQFLCSSAVHTGVSAYCCQKWERASFLNRGPRTPDEILLGCSKSRRKSLRRGQKRLEARGEIGYRLVHPHGGMDPAVNVFLHLERRSWKGQAGTAIACHPDHESFFRQMVDGFSRRESVLFGELLLDGVPIASTCNLRCGNLLSAFKIGWDPAYAEASIGLWSEVHLASAISQQTPEIIRIDSSAKRGSYVESVWQDRTPMISVTYTWSNRGTAMQLARQYLHHLKAYGSSSPPGTPSVADTGPQD